MTLALLKKGILQMDIRIHARWTGDIADKRNVKYEECCLPPSEPLSGRGGSESKSAR